MTVTVLFCCRAEHQRYFLIFWLFSQFFYSLKILLMKLYILLSDFWTMLIIDIVPLAESTLRLKRFLFMKDGPPNEEAKTENGRKS